MALASSSTSSARQDALSPSLSWPQNINSELLGGMEGRYPLYFRSLTNDKADVDLITLNSPPDLRPLRSGPSHTVDLIKRKQAVSALTTQACVIPATGRCALSPFSAKLASPLFGQPRSLVRGQELRLGFTRFCFSLPFFWGCL